MKKSKKYNDTSVRVLETLKVLSEKNMSIQDIIKHFEKIDPNNRTYTNEVILKYINTLKVFGFKFIKERDKYVLLNSPCCFNFNKDDLKAIAIIEQAANIFPEAKLKMEANIFLQNLEKRFNDNTRILSQEISRPEFKDLEEIYNKNKEIIKQYEKYCLDGQRLKITYLGKGSKELTIMAEPANIKYSETKAYLSVYNPASAQIQDLDFETIIKIEQLPLKVNSMNMFSSVTFELKGRLAKAYKLHDGERLIQIKTNGNLVIINQKEDKDILLRRLIKYGELCEVLAPKNFREQTQDTIQKTLERYSKD